MKNTNIFKITLIAIVYFTSYMSFSQEYKGSAFLDANGNGTKDVNEKGLESILISDGLHFTKTDKNGNFEIKGFDKFHFIMAHIPATFQTTKYYYSIDENVSSYDFAFTPKKKVDKFQFVHISDTETYEFRDWLNVLKEYVNNEDPSFIMLTGDICYKRGMQFHSDHINNKTMGTPMRLSVGNHDLVAGDYGEQFYEQRFGPVYYSFEEGNVLFISTPMLWGDYKPGYSKEQVYDWLKNLLEQFPKEQPKVFYNHDLLTEGDEFNYDVNEDKKLNLNDYNLKAWVYGHFHNNNIKVHGDSGIKSICTSSPVMGGVDHSPSMFRIINVDEEGNMTTELRYTAINKHIETITPKAGQICKLEQGVLPISINTYHSASATERVRYSVNKVEFTPDWHDLKSDEGWHEMNQQSDFNWTARWKPDSESEGKTYTLRVQAFLKNGLVIRTKEDFVYKRNVFEPKTNKDWSQLLANSSHTGDPESTINGGLKLVWVKNAGANMFMSSPVIGDHKVFVAAMDDSNYEKGAIVAYNANTGTELWKYKTIGSVKNSMAYTNGNIVATDTKGITYAINGATGELSWKTDLKMDKMSPFVSGIATHKDIIYTGLGKDLSALDSKTGKRLWKNEAYHGGIGTTPTLTVANDMLIASLQWGSLIGHDAKSGKVLWRRKDEGIRFRDASTTFKDGYLYVPTSKNLIILNHKTGETVKFKETDYNFNISAVPLVTETLIVTATGNKGLVAFNKETLEEVWNFDTKPALIYTPPYAKTNEHVVEGSPVLSGNTIYFGSSDGYFYGVDVNSGKEVWKMNLGAPVFSSVAISGNLIFINDFAGNIYAFGSN